MHGWANWLALIAADDYRKLLGRPNRKQELASLRRRMRQGIPNAEEKD